VGRIVKKKVVTYFKTISFTFPKGNEYIREVNQVDTNSPKTRMEEGNKREERNSSPNNLPVKLEQNVPKLRHIKFRRRGITQKKAYNKKGKVKNLEDCES